MSVGTLPLPPDWLLDDRARLEDEKGSLLRRLGELNHDRFLGVLERSAERRALKARIDEITKELRDL